MTLVSALYIIHVVRQSLPVGCALSIVRNRAVEEALEMQSAVFRAAVGIAANS